MLLRLNLGCIRIKSSSASLRNTVSHTQIRAYVWHLTILHLGIHGNDSKCAKVQLPSAQFVNDIMVKQHSIRIKNTQLSISRIIPNAHHSSHRITTGLSIEIRDSGDIPEEHIRAIVAAFQRHGSISWYECVSQRNIFAIFDK